MTLDSIPDHYSSPYPIPLDAQQRRHSDGDTPVLCVSTQRCVEVKQEPKGEDEMDAGLTRGPYRRSLSQGALEEQLDAPSLNFDPTASARVVEIVDNFFYVFYKKHPLSRADKEENPPSYVPK